MSKRAFNKIMQGVKEARFYLEGTADKRRYRVHGAKLIQEAKVTREPAKRQFAKGSR